MTKGTNVNRKYFVYPKLLQEMQKHKESCGDLAKVLGLSRTSTNYKVAGKVQWTIGEVETICNHYNKNYYELFKDE